MKYLKLFEGFNSEKEDIITQTIKDIWESEILDSRLRLSVNKLAWDKKIYNVAITKSEEIIEEEPQDANDVLAITTYKSIPFKFDEVSETVKRIVDYVVNYNEVTNKKCSSSTGETGNGFSCMYKCCKLDYYIDVHDVNNNRVKEDPFKFNDDNLYFNPF